MGYTVDANSSTSARSGTISVGGQSFTVNQAGISCTYALSFTSFNHSASAGSGKFFSHLASRLRLDLIHGIGAGFTRLAPAMGTAV